MSTSFNQDLEKGHPLSSQSTSNSEQINLAPTAINDDNDPEYSRKHNNIGSNILRVTTSTTGDVIYLGNQAFHRNELLNAFGGDFNPGIHHQPYRPMGNPVPLGLVGFAICTLTAGFLFVQGRGVTNGQLLAGPCMFAGGIITIVAGFWCLVVENTFASCALGAFGGFYTSYAAILMDAFGVVSAYAGQEDQYNSLMGFYLTGWVIFAFSMWLCTFKATWSFFLMIGFVVFYLLLLCISFFLNNLDVRKGAGVFALLAAFTGFYAIYEGNANHENSYLVPPQFPMPGAPRI